MQCVYRFVDLEDDKVKYIGIIFGETRTLKQRTYEHTRYDDWCKRASWKVEYIDVSNRAEAESLESHFIALYDTGRFYNKAKSEWGVNSFLTGVQFQWDEYCRVFGGESQVTGDYPTPFTRIGFGTWWRDDIHNFDLREHIIFGRREDNGMIYFSDGSTINADDVGKVFCSDYQLRGFCGESSRIISDRFPRKPKLANIDIVSYCEDGADLKSVKSLMIDVVMSAVEKDCGMRKLRYENAYRSYQSTVNQINRLAAIKNSI